MVLAPMRPMDLPSECPAIPTTRHEKTIGITIIFISLMKMSPIGWKTCSINHLLSEG